MNLNKDKNMGKNVQIEQELFFDLIKYFCLDDMTETRHNDISKRLEAKLDKMFKHELYTKYKTAPTEQEREQARKEYLDKVGIHKDFRW